jgi:hypothetical protein
VRQSFVSGSNALAIQERELFRADYEGTTSRDHLGLARPANPFFEA